MVRCGRVTFTKIASCSAQNQLSIAVDRRSPSSGSKLNRQLVPIQHLDERLELVQLVFRGENAGESCRSNTPIFLALRKIAVARRKTFSSASWRSRVGLTFPFESVSARLCKSGGNTLPVWSEMKTAGAALRRT